MRQLVDRAGLNRSIVIDSAGTGDWHVGEERDRRSSEVGRRRGIHLAGRARQFTEGDFARFDYVLAMDRKNLTTLRSMAPDEQAASKVHLLRGFAPGANASDDGESAASGRRGQDSGVYIGQSDDEVPDPYFGGPEGFDRVFDICIEACEGLLAHLRRTHRL